MEEITFLHDQNVLVTNQRYIAKGKTYAVRNISSVSIVKMNKPPILLLLPFFFAFLIYIGFDNYYKYLSIIVMILGLIFWFLVLKNNYIVKIQTNSGEIKSIYSKERPYMVKIVEALNQAIIHN